MNKTIKYFEFFLSLGLFLGVLSGCSSEEVNFFYSDEDTEVKFIGYVDDNVGIETRAPYADPTTEILGSRYGDTKFHIYERGHDKDNNLVIDQKDYVIPNGTKGYLTYDGDDKYPLNWVSRKGIHEFWSWTTPWLQNIEKTDYAKKSDDFGKSMKINFCNSSIVETDKDAKFIKGWKNGQDLELFVGASHKDLIYQSNGEFVTFQYRHLVSKIFLHSFTMVNNATQSSSSSLKGNITFYGVPDKMIFYPTPYDENGDLRRDENGEVLTRPIVYPDPDAKKIVTYALTNNSSHSGNPSFTEENGSGILKPNEQLATYTIYDCWYICPETDLSKVSYKIEIYEYVTNVGWVPNREYGLNGAFYGDFKDVKFNRVKGQNNKNDKYDVGDGSDDTVLHAGEYLVLSFNLSTKGNASASGSITDWATQSQERGASTLPQSGIFTLDEAKSLSNVMKEGNKDEINERSQIFGSGENTGSDPSDPNYSDKLDIIKLRDDIGYSGTGTSTSGESGKMSEFYIDDGYILDGMGHTINMTSYSSVKIGKMRDVYLRYYTSTTSNGVTKYTEYIVYIDKKGKIWLVDPSTYREIPTDYNINDATSNPITINLQTGMIS